jgi:hypothetical protein
MLIGMVRAGIACLVLCVFAVASNAQSVQTDFDRSFDFSKLKTFNFAVQRRGLGDALAQDPLNNGRIRAALEANLEAGGFVSGGDARPDFAVAYYVSTRDALNVQDYSFGPPRWFGRRDIRVNQYTEGTLTVDFIDVATRQVVWRGLASGSVELKDAEKRVNRAVEKLVKQFLKDARRRG